MPVRLVSNEEPLPGYRLIERIGRGGFGEVWKVEAPGGLFKAMKFVFGDLEAMDDDSRPAEQELKALKRVQDIRHPYILSLERYDILDGQLTITMELADKNLWERFRECRSLGYPGIPRGELLRYMEETAEALDLMNNCYQIQHLDIKPQNLFLVCNHVKVGDFGLAKLLEGVRATVTGGVTPVYAAPETFDGWISRYSDQYSLAIVFQELLTGSRPFNGANTRQLLMQHLNGTPELSPLPSADRTLIARALNKKPDDRWPSCTELVRALKLSGQTGAPPYPTVVGSHPGPMPQESDSVQATRMAVGGSGRVGPEQTQPVQVFPIKPSPPANSTPLPPLPPLVSVGGGVAPKLATQTAANALSGPAITLQRPAIFQTARMGNLGIAPPEKTGEGTLFPALVVALGKTGRQVVEQFKQVVRDRFGSPERVPNVRVLYIDTDPEAAEIGPAAGNPAALTAREVVYARLNRPAHYLQRDTLPPLEPWMPPGVLYKLGRTGGAAGGVRAFGRLALLDNYRLIAQRLRQEVESFLTDDALMLADQNTALGVRTNRPRVYVVAGLAGGTGGGMFLDMAYLIRHELRQVGFTRPDVNGMFFLPKAERSSPRNAALGNAHAALGELRHYSAGTTRYQNVFDKAEAAVTDADPPFVRAAVFEYPKSQKPAELQHMTGLAARGLFQELLTPAGRAVDEVRDAYRRAYPTVHPTVQTFGLFRLSWPRLEMLAAATRRFAQRILQRWTAKDAAHLREPVTDWLNQQWKERRLGFEATAATFHRAVREALHEDPDRVFDAFIDPLRTRSPSGGRLDAASACNVLDQLLKLVGKPDCENDPQLGSLNATLTGKFEELAREAETHLAFMAVSFIEQPMYRLAGAEEAVRQIGDRLKFQIDALEPRRRELDKEIRTAYAKLFQAIGGLGSITGLTVRKGAVTGEVLDLLRVYPRKRLHLHVLDMCLAMYRKLHGNAPEYLREINYCRSALAEMHAALKGDGTGPATGPGKLILPDGCKDLDEAADTFLAGLPPEDLMAFDQALQKDTARKFRGLVTVCLKAKAKEAAFRELLLKKSREFLDAKLGKSDPAVVFFRDRTEDSAANLIREAFDEAAPDLVPANGAKPDELVVLACPPGGGGDRFRAVAEGVLPPIDVTPAPLPDDIAFYREYPGVEIADLPQSGESARDAYNQMAAAEHPPHARIDVPWTATTTTTTAPV